MKIALLVLAFMFITSMAFAQDVTISITIPSAKAAKVLEGFLQLHPNTETKPDPTWIDPGDGSVAPWIPAWTDKTWIKEELRRFLIRDARRGLQAIQNENQVPEDNGMAT